MLPPVGVPYVVFFHRLVCHNVHFAARYVNGDVPVSMPFSLQVMGGSMTQHSPYSSVNRGIWDSRTQL